MPTYSYRCQGCGVEFDIQQAFADSALTTCDACGGSLRKLFNTIGVTFNGSGFYRNDSRATPAKTEKKAATPATPKKTSESSPSKTPATSA